VGRHLLSAPTLLSWFLASKADTRPISDGDFALGVLIGCVLATACWWWDQGQALRAFPSDPTLG
jgi:hypothetical protein